MSDVSEEIKNVLVDESIGIFANVDPTEWGIYLGQEPTDPDQVITLYTTGGPQTQYVMDRDVPACRQSLFQVRVRALSYPVAQAKMWEIALLLKQYGPWTGVDGWEYNTIFEIGEPLLLKYDDRDRPIFVDNFRVHRKAPESP